VVRSLPATTNHAVALSLLSQPRWHGEKSQKEKAKLVSCNKNCLTEWQREKKNNNDNTDKKNTRHAMFLPPNAQLPAN